MKNKIDKYIDLATKVHLANVPFDKSEAETLLKENKCGTAQNYFKRFIHYFGKHYIMIISSIIALILSGLYLSAPSNEIHSNLSEARKQSTMQQKQITNDNFDDDSNIKNNNALLAKKLNISNPNHQAILNQSYHSDHNDYNYKVEREIVDTTYLKEYDISELNWEMIVFNHEDWSFRWISRIEREESISEDGKPNYRVSQFLSALDDKYLVPILKQLEDSLKTLINPIIIKSLCNLPIEEYFDELAELGNSLENQASNEKLIPMFNLYAYINRKLLNNPQEMMKMKTKGIVLPKNILEKLGIKFTENTFSVPIDEYCANDIAAEKRIKWYEPKNIDTNNLPKNPSILKKDYVYEWAANLPVYNDKFNVNWQNNYCPLANRQEFKDSQLKGKVETQSYYNCYGFVETDQYRRTSPLILAKFTAMNYQDAILKYTNDASKKLFDFAANMEEYIKDYSKYNSKKLIFDNMINAFKLRYLIPVDIQIPYFGFSEEELKNMEATFITLWYYPNEEFLSALPEDIRIQLEKEISISSRILKGEIQPEEACQEVGKKESLLGLCNLTNKSIANLNLFPNPASSNLNVKFDLLESGYYKLILSDLNGSYLDELTDWNESDKGQINLNFDLSKLQNGTYLMQVFNEKGEKLLSKFSISR